MTITRTDVDALNITLSIKIEKPDYEEVVAKALKEYRRKAQLPGFRPGNVPMNVVQKIYGKNVLYDETLKLLDKIVNDYINEHGLRILGEPIPNEQAPLVDFETQTEFEFVQDFALRPEIKLMPEKISLPLYSVSVSEEDVQAMLDEELRMTGKMVESEAAAGDDFLLRVDAAQDATDGIIVKDGMLTGFEMNAEQRKKMQGLKAGDKISVNIREMLTNDADCAAFLGINKNQLADINPVFSITVNKVECLQPSALGQEFYDRVWGAGAVTTEDQCRAKIKEEISMRYAQRSRNLFAKQVHSALMSSTNIPLPEGTLRRWLKLTASKEKPFNEETFEREAADFFTTMRWSLIVEEIARSQGITVEEEDVRAYVQDMIRRELMVNYGMSNITADTMEALIDKSAQDEKIRRSAAETIIVNKAIDAFKTMAAIEHKTLSTKEYDKIESTFAAK
jgi:trigger factor